MPLALLLDIDGTLLDTLDAIVAATNAALAEAGHPPLRTEELRPLVGVPIDRQMRMLRGMDGPAAEAIGERYYRHFVRIVEKEVVPYPGVKETFARLSGRRIGTVSTRRKEVATLMLRVGGILRYFTAAVGGEEVARPKPEPDLALFAPRSIDVPPSGCVVVGDSPIDIQAGNAAGMRTVAATYGYGELRALRGARPHAEIASFPELPGVLEDFEASASRWLAR